MKQFKQITLVLLFILTSLTTSNTQGIAINQSTITDCQEHDNVSYLSYCDEVTQFSIIATHPIYLEPGTQDCSADFANCPSASPTDSTLCTTLYDDGNVVIKSCTVDQWWLNNSMNINVIGGDFGSGHYLVIQKKIEGVQSYPEFFVLYQDSYMRMIPHPPSDETPSVCYGSSVIVGPADPNEERPFAEIDQVSIDPLNLMLEVIYAGNLGSANISLDVNTTMAKAVIDVNYDLTGKPFAIFRSMFVNEGACDVAYVAVGMDTIPIMEADSLLSDSWFFHRKQPSSHNNSAPDILIKIEEQVITSIPPRADVSENISIYPNPASDIITIESNGFNFSPYNISLATIDGKILDHFSFDTDKNSIDCSKYPSGMYLLIFASNNNRFFRKILKL